MVTRISRAKSKVQVLLGLILLIALALPLNAFAEPASYQGQFTNLTRFTGPFTPNTASSNTSTGEMITPRSDHTATLLKNGQVLVAGGVDVHTQFLSSAELYDPVTNNWSSTGNLLEARSLQKTTLLANGQVLVIGGKKKNWDNLTT